MATLYLDRSGLELRPDGKALALYENGERVRSLPLKLVDRVVVHGELAFSSRVLTSLVEEGASVIFLSRRQSRRVATVLGAPHQDARRRYAQYAWVHDGDRCLQVAERLLRAKLRGQARLLARLARARPDARKPLLDGLTEVRRCLAQLRTKAAARAGEELDRIRGLEGAAARSHFAALTAAFPPALGFAGRNRRPPRDPVNACLSLAYTLLHHEAVTAAYGAGLDPYLGFLHSVSFGRESLAADLIEPLRPQADEHVWRLFNERTLRAEHFSDDRGACLLGKAGREHFYAAWEAFVTPRRRLLRRMARLLVRQLPLPEDGEWEAL